MAASLASKDFAASAKTCGEHRRHGCCCTAGWWRGSRTGKEARFGSVSSVDFPQSKAAIKPTFWPDAPGQGGAP